MASKQKDSDQSNSKVWAIVLDRYIGEHTDGADWAKTARELFPASRIFLSSNDRSLRLPIAGVDEIIPKDPMSLDDLWERASKSLAAIEAAT